MNTSPFPPDNDPEDVVDAEWIDDDSDDARSRPHRGRPGDPKEGPMGFLLGPDGPFGAGGIFGPNGPLSSGRPFGAKPPFGPGKRSGWEEFFESAGSAGGFGGAERGPRGPHTHGRGGGFDRPERPRHRPERPQHGPGGGGRGRRRRGDVRLAALFLLNEEPRNGYQIIEELGARTEGGWRPSSGAIYPALAQLEDEGLIEAFDREGRKAYRLTDAGREHVADLGDAPRPWDEAANESRQARRSAMGGASSSTLWSGLGQVGMAAHAVSQAGDERLVTEAAAVLERTKKELYRLLADGPAAGQSDQAGPQDAPFDAQD